MRALLGTGIDARNAFFGPLTDFREILVQAAVLVLGTPLGSLDEFPSTASIVTSTCLRRSPRNSSRGFPPK